MKHLNAKKYFKLLKVSFLSIAAILLTTCAYSVANPDSLRKSQTVAKAPIPLQITKENQGKRCEFTQYNSFSENLYCYKLQEKLITSAGKGDLEEIEKALAFGANVDAGYYQSFSALYHASMSGQTQSAVLLIDNGANVNRVFIFGQTPLKAAVYYNHPKVVKILVERGANVCEDSPSDTNQKNTALDIAQERGFSEIEKMLLQNGAVRCVFNNIF